MANKRKGQLTVSGEWAKHLRPLLRRAFWRTERQAGQAIARVEGAGDPPRAGAGAIEKARMENGKPIRCRMVACREALDDGKAWSFYLLNDSDVSLESAVLHEIGYEWGDMGNSEAADVRVADLMPAAHALVWRDDGSGAELRMELFLRVRAHGHELRLRFEFPKLYLQRDLQVVDGLGKRGWQVAAEASVP